MPCPRTISTWYTSTDPGPRSPKRAGGGRRQSARLTRHQTDRSTRMPMYDDTGEARIGKKTAQFFGGIEPHSLDPTAPLHPPFIGRVSRFAANQEIPARTQYAPDLGKGPGQVLPKIEGFKSRHRIEHLRSTRQRFGRSLHDGSTVTGILQGTAGAGHAFGRRINPANRSFGTTQKKLGECGPAAATDIQHPPRGLPAQKRQGPPKKRCMTAVHPAEHDAPDGSGRKSGMLQDTVCKTRFHNSLFCSGRQQLRPDQ